MPSELGRLTGLANDFELNYNFLSGVVPSELGRLTLLGTEQEDHEDNFGETHSPVPDPTPFPSFSAAPSTQKMLPTNTPAPSVTYAPSPVPTECRCLTPDLFPSWNLIVRDKVTQEMTDVAGRLQACGGLPSDEAAEEPGSEWPQTSVLDYYSVGEAMGKYLRPDSTKLAGNTGFRACGGLTYTQGAVYHGMAYLPKDASLGQGVSFREGYTTCGAGDPAEAAGGGDRRLGLDLEKGLDLAPGKEPARVWPARRRGLLGEDDEEAAAMDDVLTEDGECEEEPGECAALCLEDHEATGEAAALMASNAEYYGCASPASSYGTLTFDAVAAGPDPETGATYICVNASALLAASKVVLLVESNDFLVISVLDDTAEGSAECFGNFGLEASPSGLTLEETYTRVAWAFNGTEALCFDSVGWPGTIVAPDADVTCGYGNYNGNLYAKSLTGPCEGHWFPPRLPVCTMCGFDGWDGLDHDSDFRLRNNRFSGRIPSELGLLTALDGEFGLDNNGFTGEIPSELGTLESLTRFGLSVNPGLCNKIPKEVVNLEEDVEAVEITEGSPGVGKDCCIPYPDDYACWPTDDAGGLAAATVALIAVGAALLVVGGAAGAAVVRKRQNAAAVERADNEEMILPSTLSLTESGTSGFDHIAGSTGAPSQVAGFFAPGQDGLQADESLGAKLLPNENP